MAILGPFKVNRGLNAKASAFTLPQNQALVFNNFYIDYDIIKTMQGTFSLGSLNAFTVQGLTFWSDPNNILSTNNANTIIVVSNSKLGNAPFLTGDDAQALTFTDRTGALTLSSGTGLFGLSYYYSFDSLNGILIGVGASLNSQALFKMTAYNANGAVLGGSPPPADAVKVVNNFVFIGRNLSGATTLSRVYWSNVGDPETWGASNYVDFRKNDGDMITALGSIGQDLIIFKNRSIGRLYTTPPTTDASVTLGPLVTLSTSIGCCGPQAVDSLPDGRLVFLGSDLHLYIFDGVSFQDLTDLYDGMPNIQNYIIPDTVYSSSGNLVSNQKMTIVAVKYYPTKKQIWIAFGTLPFQALIFDLRSKAWSINPAANINLMCIAGPARTSQSNYPYILLSGASTGVVNLHDRQDVLWSQTTAGGNSTSEFQWSITFSGESDIFLPRSLLLPITGTNSNSSINIWFGFDGVLNGSITKTLSGVLPILNRITIPIKEDTVQKKPVSLMIKIHQTGASPMFLHPFYISDQVMS